MTDLTDFLLARIAEDEAGARRLLRSAQETHLTLSDPSHLGRTRPGWYEWPAIEAMCVRVLAECEAKRRIVERAKFFIWQSDRIDESLPDTHCDGPSGQGNVGRMHGVATGFEEVLEYLALPHADHPEYREEWRR